MYPSSPPYHLKNPIHIKKITNQHFLKGKIISLEESQIALLSIFLQVFQNLLMRKLS